MLRTPTAETNDDNGDRADNHACADTNDEVDKRCVCCPRLWTWGSSLCGQSSGVLRSGWGCYVVICNVKGIMITLMMMMMMMMIVMIMMMMTTAMMLMLPPLLIMM